MPSASPSTAPSTSRHRTQVETARLLKRLKRFLVVDADDGGDTLLPNGKRGKGLASYHTSDLAFALASGERQGGRRVLVLDSKPPGHRKGKWE